MTQALAHRSSLAVPVLAAAALAYGALVGARPLVAAALAALAVIVALAFMAPLAHLSLLVAMTAIVPYSIANQFSVSGGEETAGLLLSDVLLLTGLARAAVVLPRTRLVGRQLLLAALVIGFGVFALVAAYTGIRAGRGASEVGAELRTLGGFATALMAMAVLADPRARARLGAALTVAGLVLGLWGVAQWATGIDFGSAGDFGVRAGVSFTSDGRGQIQGGLFAFPVAVVIGVAALVSGQVTSRLGRVAVVGAVGLNVISLLLTFERTFWIASVVGVILVVLRSGRRRRGRAVLWGVVLTCAAFALLATVSPGTMATARERFLSIGQYESDGSLRYRRVESRHVVARIRDAPLAGSGLAATIWWGRPWEGVPARATNYSHNGYLWLVWRLGFIGAGLLFLALALAVAWRGAPPEGSTFAAVRSGAQAALVALLLASVTFPIFNGYGITAVVGVLLAIAAVPRDRPEPARRPSAA